MKIITSEQYQIIFEKDPIGQAILEDLMSKFYDTDGYEKGDPSHCIYTEGQRSVVRFILRRLAQIPTSDQGE